METQTHETKAFGWRAPSETKGRMSAERMETARKQLEGISEEDYAKVKALANIVKPLRSVLFKTPDDHGMTGWRDIYFQSDDGTPLEG